MFGQIQKATGKQGQGSVYLGEYCCQSVVQQAELLRQNTDRRRGESTDQRRCRPWPSHAPPTPATFAPFLPEKSPSRSSGKSGRPAGISVGDPQCRRSLAIHPESFPDENHLSSHHCDDRLPEAKACFT